MTKPVFKSPVFKEMNNYSRGFQSRSLKTFVCSNLLRYYYPGLPLNSKVWFHFYDHDDKSGDRAMVSLVDQKISYNYWEKTVYIEGKRVDLPYKTESWILDNMLKHNMEKAWVEVLYQ